MSAVVRNKLPVATAVLEERFPQARAHPLSEGGFASALRMVLKLAICGSLLGPLSRSQLISSLPLSNIEADQLLQLLIAKEVLAGNDAFGFKLVKHPRALLLTEIFDAVQPQSLPKTTFDCVFADIMRLTQAAVSAELKEVNVQTIIAEVIVTVPSAR